MGSRSIAMVQLIDTTLREGEQTPNVFFSFLTKKRIIDGLVGLGIDEIELGTAWPMNQELVSLARYLRDNWPRQSFSFWCRCHEEDIAFAAGLQPSRLSLSIPASDLHLARKLNKSRAWVLERLTHSIKQALDLGVDKVALGLEDATRADPGFVKNIIHAAREAGAFRVRLADTVGIATPASLTRLLRGLGHVGVELGVHCHNDFGMATANTITAFEQGVRWGDVTILGLGERAGNSRLEEILAYLVLRTGAVRYRLAGLRELSTFTAKRLGRRIPAGQPIIGQDLFHCETGLHLLGLMAEPATYEPFDPQLVGARRKLQIGAKAGRRSIAATLKRLDLPCPDETALRELTRRVRKLGTEYHRPLSDYEIIRLSRMV